MDADKSGAICWTEFLVASFDYEQVATEKRLKQSFEKFHTQHSQQVAKSRMMFAIRNSLLSKSVELGERLDFFDKQKDQEIDVQAMKHLIRAALK